MASEMYPVSLGFAKLATRLRIFFVLLTKTNPLQTRQVTPKPIEWMMMQVKVR